MVDGGFASQRARRGRSDAPLRRPPVCAGGARFIDRRSARGPRRHGDYRSAGTGDRVRQDYGVDGERGLGATDAERQQHDQKVTSHGAPPGATLLQRPERTSPSAWKRSMLASISSRLMETLSTLMPSGTS